MFTLKNKSVIANWYEDLSDYAEIENALPFNGFNIRNDSSQIAYIELNGRKVGEVQRYSSDTFTGRTFSTFRIYNPDDADFAVDELFVQVSKGGMMTSQPFNPQWDMIEDDFDRYATGCDSRISLSATYNSELIKYWMNVQQGLIVQRRLDILGGTSVGSYEISFGNNDILSGSTPIDFPVVDLKRYRKINASGALDYTLTNCSIKGWMFDYFKNPNDISDDYTEEVCLGTPPFTLAFDDDLTTSTDSGYTINISVGYHTYFEVSFSSRTISRIHTYFYLASSNNYSGDYVFLQFQLKVDNVWTTVIEINTSSKTIFYESNLNTYDLVTGIRFNCHNPFATENGRLKVYDLSAF